VKGPALAAVAYRRPDLRAYKDLDLLVPAPVFEDAVRLLEANGIPLLDRNWTLVSHEVRGQLHLQLPMGTVTDLHWHLVNQYRDRLRIPMGELFDRSRRVEVGGRPVSVLDPVDGLIHICLHAALSGGERLIWLKDLDLLRRKVHVRQTLAADGSFDTPKNHEARTASQSLSRR
jgi:hypothetical protein